MYIMSLLRPGYPVIRLTNHSPYFSSGPIRLEYSARIAWLVKGLVEVGERRAKLKCEIWLELVLKNAVPPTSYPGYT